MSTNNTFSFNRFGKYFRMYIAQHGRFFGQCVLAAYAIFTIIFVVFASIMYSSIALKFPAGLNDEVSSMTSAISIVALVPLMCIVASHMMHTMHNKRTRLHTLTTPTSSLEKYLSYLLIHVVGFFFAYFCVTYAADMTRTFLCKIFYPGYAEHIRFAKATLIQPIAPKDFYSYAVIPLVFIQSYFVLGSTVWSRFSFFKTLGFGIIGIFVIILALNIISDRARFIIHLHVIPEYTTYIVLIPTLFNWYMGYRRFKEAGLVHQL